MDEKAAGSEPVYGIGAVAKMTGLTDHTIRVWERRYDAVVTERTENGRRVYRTEDVEKLRLLQRLTQQGLSIGQIANKSIAELRRSIQGVNDVVTASMPDKVRVAVLGDYLPGRLTAYERDTAPIEMLVVDNNKDRFAADLRCQSVDVVVLETPTLDPGAKSQLVDYMVNSDAKHGILVYTFGRAQDVELARNAGIHVLRAPVDAEELLAAVTRAFNEPAAISAPLRQSPRADSAAWSFSGAIAPRIFNQQQLANLANTASSIDCECPQHLAQLVSDLSAFEIYSANCVDRDEDDAALHRYLHQTTAQARSIVEIALEKVAEAEGLTY